MEFDESNFDFENSNLPNQLDEFTFPVFDPRSQPFSPTSPGVRSPCRPRTMKEYEEDLATLKGENFNLKVRIYFLEQHRTDPTLPKDVDELRHLYTGLKVQHDIQKKDLETKESLLLDAYKALDVQKKELEAMEQEKLQDLQEKQELRCRVENLEKELKDYHQRFMETSVPHLDDTNALYAMTFGLHTNAGPSAGEPLAEEKEIYCGISINMRELQEELARYKERVRLLEGEIAVLNDKNVDDEKNLQKVKSQLQEVEERLEKILGERDRYEKLYSKASIFTAKLEKSVNNTLKEKDAETGKFRSLAEELRKQLTEVENQLQETQERSSRSQTEKKIKILYSENEKLKHELKRLQQHTEERSPRNRDQEPRPSDLQREIQYLKSNNRNGQKVIQTMCSENKRLTAQLEELKETVRILRGNTAEPSKEEVS